MRERRREKRTEGGREEDKEREHEQKRGKEEKKINIQITQFQVSQVLLLIFCKQAADTGSTYQV